MKRRWTEEEINAWAAQRPWFVGMNFLPSTAVNWNEMWAKETFDLPTIKHELSYAQSIGMNTLRTNLPFIVYLYDKEGLIERIDQFLAAASECGIHTMLTLMDDCGFSGEHPYIGFQGEPRPGVHNSRGAASPGRNVVTQKLYWPLVEEYIRTIVRRFKDDERILIWDVYNEPSNDGIFGDDGQMLHFQGPLTEHSLELCRQAVSWVRDEDPSQPLTVGAWRNMKIFIDRTPKIFDHEIDKMALELSDVITFHAYSPKDVIEETLAILEPLNRPIMCTEWLARHAQSTVEDILPIFAKHKVGAYNWGLVNGKTQTHLPWPVIMQASPDYIKTWFHDLFKADGSAYDQAELDLFASLIKEHNAQLIDKGVNL